MQAALLLSQCDRPFASVTTWIFYPVRHPILSIIQPQLGVTECQSGDREFATRMEWNGRKRKPLECNGRDWWNVMERPECSGSKESEYIKAPLL
jgi:hypothetical protein